MTTVAAIQGKNWVVMGADSQSTHGDRKIYMADDKIVNNNGILIAGCGSPRGTNLVQHIFKAPKPVIGRTTEQLDKWMTSVFIPDLRQTFMDNGYDMKADGDFAQHDSEFLVAVQGIVYLVSDDYSWDRDVRGYMTSGSGGDYAQGVLFASDDKIFTNLAEAKRAMKKAIDAGKEFDSSSGGETKIYVQQAE